MTKHSEIEYQQWHYRMWDYITSHIRKHKVKANVYDLKLDFLLNNADELKDKGWDIWNLAGNCFMCEFSQYYHRGGYSYKCPSKGTPVCDKLIRGCLDGLYLMAIKSSTWQEQIVACELIRDSWRDIKNE